jgi:hypothetical protein
MGVNQYTRKWERIKTFGGKLAENCIAENTPVLTNIGWVAIQDVTREHLVWDGLEFVKNNGCVFKGKQVVLSAYRVIMTPDHKVLTTNGWKSASSCEGYSRATSGIPNGYSQLGLSKGQANTVGAEMRLRCYGSTTSEGVDKVVEKGGDAILRMPEVRDSLEKENYSRDVKTPGVLRMEEYARSLPTPYSSGMAQLRRAWNIGVRRVARVVREFLGGHGSNLPSGVNLRAYGQHGKLQQRKLPVAYVQAPSEQQEGKCSLRYAIRQTNGSTSSRPVRHQENNFPLSNGAWLEPIAGVKPVYDIVDCGPRNRFVVMGSDGQLLIVHNCTQAGARDIFKHGGLLAERAGYELVIPVHDELVTEVPDTEEYTAEGLAALMSVVPEWAKGIPLAAEGFEAYRYRK